MMRRRLFLQGLGIAASMSLLSPLRVFGKMANAVPALPILMFHKVDDNPRYPEDISTEQLARLFDFVWQQGFYPVNMSDILTNGVDAVVPRGLKPIGVTADDAHPSVVFSQSNSSHPGQRNARSMVNIFCESLKPYSHSPRATLFMSAVADDRVSRTPESYFGDVRPLSEILDELALTPGIETGFHTERHENMKSMNATQVRAIIDEQLAAFAKRGVQSRVRRILAYPYGVPPSEDSIKMLKDMGFLGAVLALPGTKEARYTSIPACEYDGTLQTDPFMVPRVCVGAYAYAPAGAASPYLSIDPIEDFKKDVVAAMPNLYTSAGR